MEFDPTGVYAKMAQINSDFRDGERRRAEREIPRVTAYRDRDGTIRQAVFKRPRGFCSVCHRDVSLRPAPPPMKKRFVAGFHHGPTAFHDTRCPGAGLLARKRLPARGEFAKTGPMPMKPAR